MKKVFALFLLVSTYAIGYTMGNEDGLDYHGQYVYNCGSIGDALSEAETCLLRIQCTPNGYAKIDKHLEDAFFWIGIAKDMTKEQSN